MLRTPKKAPGRRHEPYSPSPASPSPRFHGRGLSPAHKRPPPSNSAGFCFRVRQRNDSPASKPPAPIHRFHSPSPAPAATQYAPRSPTDAVTFSPTLDRILEEADRVSERVNHWMDSDNRIFFKELDRLVFKTDVKAQLLKQRAISKRAEATAPAKIAQRDAECSKQWRMKDSQNARNDASSKTPSRSRRSRFSAATEEDEDEDEGVGAESTEDTIDDVFGPRDASDRDRRVSDANKSDDPRFNFDSENEASGSDIQSSPSTSTPNTSPAMSVRTADTLWSNLEEERARLTAERQALDDERLRMQEEKEAAIRAMREEEARRAQEKEVAIRAALEKESRRVEEEKEAAIRAVREEESRRVEEERRRLQEQLDRVIEQNIRLEAEHMEAEHLRSRLEEQQTRTVEEEERLRALHQERVRFHQAAQEQARVEEQRRTELEARLQAKTEATARAEAERRRLAEETARRDAEEAELVRQSQEEIRAHAEAEQSADAARRYNEYLQQQWLEQEHHRASGDYSSQPHDSWQHRSYQHNHYNQYDTDAPMREQSFVNMDASMHSITDEMDYDDSSWDGSQFVPPSYDRLPTSETSPNTQPDHIPPPQPEPLPPLTPIELYNRKWEVLLEPSTAQRDLQFWQLPWPVLHEVRAPEDITAPLVTEFIHQLHLSSPYEDFRTIIRREVLHFHPDKFKGRIMHQVSTADQAAVEEAVKALTRILVPLRQKA